MVQCTSVVLGSSNERICPEDGLSCDVTYNGFIRHNPIVSRAASVLVWGIFAAVVNGEIAPSVLPSPSLLHWRYVFCSTHICPLYPRHPCILFTPAGEPCLLKEDSLFPICLRSMPSVTHISLVFFFNPSPSSSFPLRFIIPPHGATSACNPSLAQCLPEASSSTRPVRCCTLCAALRKSSLAMHT